MKAETIFRTFHESDRRELKKMILGLYSEDDYGETMSSEKIDKTITELYKKTLKRAKLRSLKMSMVLSAMQLPYFSGAMN